MVSTIHSRLEACRASGQVTDNEVVFEKKDAIVLFREPHHSIDDIHKAKRLIRRDRLTTKAITVVEV